MLNLSPSIVLSYAARASEAQLKLVTSLKQIRQSDEIENPFEWSHYR
jgi:hypothetical protein